MRSFIAASACAVALLGFAPVALAQTTGHVGAQYGQSNYETSGLKGDIDFYVLEGAVRTGTDVIGGSVDGRVTHSSDDGFHQTAFAGTAHVNTKLGDDFALLGAFGGVDRSSEVRDWGAGVEGLANLGGYVTLYAQAGYGETKDLYPLLTKVWATRADLRIFPTDNIKLQASGDYQWIKIGPIHTHAYVAGLEAEFQATQSGLSLLASYDHYRLDLIGLDSDMFRIGARYAFGGGTLKQRERSGENLGTVQRLFEIEQLR